MEQNFTLWSTITGKPLEEEDIKRINAIIANQSIKIDDALVSLVVMSDAYHFNQIQAIQEKTTSEIVNKISNSSLKEAKVIFVTNFMKYFTIVSLTMASLVMIGYLIGNSHNPSNESLDKPFAQVIEMMKNCDERNDFPVSRVLVKNEYKCVLMGKNGKPYKDWEDKVVNWTNN